MEQLRVGILSTGNIAATMADTVAKMKGSQDLCGSFQKPGEGRSLCRTFSD